MAGGLLKIRDALMKLFSVQRCPLADGGSRSDQIKRIVERVGKNFSEHPLRKAYEAEVRALKPRGEKLLESGKSEHDVAKILHQERRDLGVKYKDATPAPLRKYIYHVNEQRYGDKLGPTYEELKRRGKTDAEIIKGASNPNQNVDKLLSGFEQWLGESPQSELDQMSKES